MLPMIASVPWAWGAVVGHGPWWSDQESLRCEPAEELPPCRLLLFAWRWLLRLRGARCLVREFPHQPRRAIDLAQRFQDSPGIHVHGAGLLILVHEIPGEGLNIAVEDDPDDLALAVDGRAAGVAADDVGSRNEI